MGETKEKRFVFDGFMRESTLGDAPLAVFWPSMSGTLSSGGMLDEEEESFIIPFDDYALDAENALDLERMAEAAMVAIC